MLPAAVDPFPGAGGFFPVAPPKGGMEVEGCLLPEDVRVDVENDIWVRPSGGRSYWSLGILSSLSSLAGRFLSARFRAGENPWHRGQSLATLESVRFTGPVRLPFEAEVIERNLRVPERPRLLNDDPYGEGWVVRLHPVRESDAWAVPPAVEVRGRLAERIHELRIRCYPAVPDLELYEIGAECSATLARLDEEISRREVGEVVLLVTDDPTSPVELARWEMRSGHRLLQHREEGGLHHFLLRKEAGGRPVRKAPFEPPDPR